MRAVNLLTPELRSAQKGSGAAKPSPMETSGGIGAFALLGALALCVVAVAGYVLAGNTIKDREASLAAVSAKNDATVKHAAELKPYADFETLANDRASTVQALASARFDWEQSLRDLSRALPSDVYLSSLNGDLDGSSSGGASGVRSAISAPAISLVGCTKSQPAVASLMSRLRNIQGVTRVSLSKSEKAVQVAAGAGQVVNPCGKGAPPSFELVVFFEKSTSGAALADATKTVSTGTAAAATPAAKTGEPAATPTPAATKGATP
ncbi:MAG: PilN domain-containing protein [Solirubrobacteraceae bacterium]